MTILGQIGGNLGAHLKAIKSRLDVLEALVIPDKALKTESDDFLMTEGDENIEFEE